MIFDNCEIRSQADLGLQKVSVKKVKISGNMGGRLALLKLVFDTRTIEELTLDDC